MLLHKALSTTVMILLSNVATALNENPASQSVDARALPQALRHSLRSGNLIVSNDGQCGGSVTCQGSKYGDSCSEWGWCGSNSSYSGHGCQPAFGTCGETGSGKIPAANLQSTSTTFVTMVVTTSSSLHSSVVNAVHSATFLPTTSAAPPPTSSGGSAPSLGGTPYTLYLGTGEPSEGWPKQSQWLDFDALWQNNAGTVISGACAQSHVPENTAQETEDLRTAIQEVSKSSGVDPRFILAIVLQESNGCVRVPTTRGSISNPGLMQTYEGKASCNSNGNVMTPCPQSEITQMVQEGTSGTGPGSDCLVEALKKEASSDVSKYYKAARIYNSGSIDPSGQLQLGGATHCYSSDVANRLIGWNTGPTKCHLDIPS